MEIVIAFMLCVLAAFVYMKREDNDFAKLLKLQQDNASRLESIEKQILAWDEFKSAQRNVSEHLSTQIGEAEVKIQAIKDAPPPVMHLKLDHAVPITVVVKRDAPPPTVGKGVSSLIPTAPDSLLKRAGVKKGLNQ